MKTILTLILLFGMTHAAASQTTAKKEQTQSIKKAYRSKTEVKAVPSNPTVVTPSKPTTKKQPHQAQKAVRTEEKKSK